MPAYLYKIKDTSGLTLYGVSEAKNAQDIKRQFRDTEYYFISAQGYPAGRFAHIHLGLDDLLMFTERLASLIEAGVPILQSMHILWKQSTVRDVQIIVTHIRKKLEDGATLYEAFSAFPNVFPTMYLALISVAEVGGSLVEILKKLSQYLQDQKKFVSRVKRAAMYPMFVMSFAFLVLICMFAFVVPTFQKVLSKLHVELPLLTKILFNISAFVRNVPLIIFLVIVIIGGIILYKFLRKSKGLDYMIDALKLKIPLFKDVYYPLLIGRFTRSFSLLIGSGVPVITSLTVARGTVVNMYIESSIEEIKLQVMEGGSLYEAFKSIKTFPIMLVEMVGIGESTGKLQYLLEKVSDHLDAEVDYKLYKFLTILEPLLIIFVGAIVLVVLLGIYFPIFTLQNTLRTM